MSTGLYSGASGLAIGSGLYKGVSGLWSGASGLLAAGAAAAPVAAYPTFDGTAPSVDLNFTGGSFLVGATTYPSLAAFQASSDYEAIGKGAVTISSLGLTSFSTVGYGTTHSAAPGVGDESYLFEYDDKDATVGDELHFASWQNSLVARSITIRNATTTASIDGTSVAVSTPISLATRAATNNFALSQQGADPVNNDTSGANLTPVNRLIVGGRQDGVRQWAGTVSRVTAYNRVLVDSELAALTRRGRGLKAGYTGVNFPLAVNDGTYTYGIQCASGYGQVVYKYHNAEAQIVGYRRISTSNQSPLDDHNSGAIIVTPGGALLTAYCGHNINSTMRVRRSADKSLGGFATEVTISTAAVGTAGYTMLLVNPADNAIFIVFRADDYSWAFTKSTDDGVTWSAPAVIVEHPTTKSYMFARFIAADQMLFTMNVNSSLGTGSLSIGMFNPTTGDVTSGSGVIFNRISEADVTVGANFDNLSVFWTPPANEMTAVSQDIYGDQILFGNVIQGTPDTGDYYFAKYDGSGSRFDPANYAITQVYSGDYGSSTQQRFIGNAKLAVGETGQTLPRIYGAKKDATTAKIIRFDAANANGTSWSQTEIDSHTTGGGATVVNWRPIPVHNPSDNFKLFWCRGTYTDYDNYDMTLRSLVGEF